MPWRFELSTMLAGAWLLCASACFAVENAEGFRISRDLGKMAPEERQRLAHKAFDEYSKASEFLRAGGDRAEGAKKYLEVADKYQGLEIADKAAEMSGYLNAMAIEDKEFKEPEDIEKLSDGEKAEYYAFKLRDVSVRGCDVPGTVRVLMDSGTNDPAVKLRNMGKAAMPTLMTMLEDLRPVRSCEEGHNGNHVLRYCDVSLQLIEAITCHSFLEEAGRGRHFSNCQPEKREKALKDVREWWTKNKDKTEAEWLRNEFATNGLGDWWLNVAGAKRLIELEGKESVAFFREMLRNEPDNAWAIILLHDAGGEEVLDDIRPWLKHSERYVRHTAFRMMMMEGDEEALELALAELDDLLRSKPIDPNEVSGILATLPTAKDSRAVIAAANVLKHDNERLVEIAARSFWWALRDRGLPQGEQLRRKIIPVMASALEGKDSRYWAAVWMARVAEIPVDIEGKATPEERKKEIDKVEAWWDEHKAEYEE